MITQNDFIEKRILLVTAEYGHHYFLQLTGDNIRLLKDREAVNQISIHSVFAVFVIGDISISTSLLKKLTAQGISIIFMNQNFAVKASVLAEAEGNYLLRQKQYSDIETLIIAKGIVKNKIQNQAQILKKTNKLISPEVFARNIALAERSEDLHKLLGAEGNASKEYFQSFFDELSWVRRAPQTKEDIPNLLLDIGYTYLFNYCDALLRLFGFDVYKGVYHQQFYQRKSLVCDVMEPMRPIIDYQLLKSHHLKQINKKDFVFINGQFEFREGFIHYKKYSSLFLEAINAYKENIYEYVLSYYHYYMDRQKYPTPWFSI